MRNKKEPCGYHLELTEDEYSGLEWLQGVLKRIVAQPRHANRWRARAVLRALNEMHEHCEALHEHIHDLEIFTAVRDEHEDQVLN
jgi:hypothetical protein